ncbi:MAG: DUF2961 domain-containing protein [Lentisphaerae bacterium]|nr:DUF2961 domain-containing protein [Lentisphaerota bacterium]
MPVPTIRADPAPATPRPPIPGGARRASARAVVYVRPMSRPALICRLRPAAAAGLASVAAAAGSADLRPAAVDSDLLRGFHLRDLHVLRDYRPGKSSFVEGPDRRLGCYTVPGQRLTLLDVAGRGCLAHLWSTWREGQGNHRLRFFVDGGSAPAIEGTPDELIAAAQRMAVPPVPVPAFVGERGARNFFLPVPFENGLRIEMETIEPTWLIFWQIDYRLGDGPRRERRVSAARVDGRLELRAEGPEPPAPQPAPPVREVDRATVVPPGAFAEVLDLAGPGIVRRWTLRPGAPAAAQSALDLEIRYEGRADAAVRATVADFFGPFRGVAFDSGADGAVRTCHLPVPFRDRAVVVVRNRTAEPVRIAASAAVEPAAAWDPSWGYLHAQGRATGGTTGYRQHEVLAVRGRGHWIGMSLYATGHDHGGGDFAVIDASGDAPAFLHGINGEDYFTFAWFGRGAHLPYAIAHSNDEGRQRLHLENPYPFRRDLRLWWGAFPGLSPRSVAYWYQDEPGDSTETGPDNVAGDDWDCFGPVPVPLDADHRPRGDPLAALPSVAALDAGGRFECRCVSERFTSGWMRQRSFGPMLDLTYRARHGTKVRGEVELGGMGHAYLARRRWPSAAGGRTAFRISHDDPVAVSVNGREVFRAGGRDGFGTARFEADLRPGDNEVVVRLANFFNTDFNWAGVGLTAIPQEPAPSNP